MGAELRAKPCDHHVDLLHKVAGLCNNANQLAKVANTYGEASQQSVEEMTAIARQVWKEVKEMVTNLRLDTNCAHSQDMNSSKLPAPKIQKGENRYRIYQCYPRPPP
ncbi:MAG: plasmid mobilization relaxosome protein MobC [Ruminococcus sp.]